MQWALEDWSTEKPVTATPQVAFNSKDFILMHHILSEYAELALKILFTIHF